MTERQIGTCGSEAEHCPGDVLSSSIVLVSNQVVAGRRTVVFKRPMVGITEKHYTFNPAIQSTMNFITAIGDTQTFAYHKAHMPSVMTFVATDGSAACVCSQGATTESDSSGSECERFVKPCILIQMARFLVKESNLQFKILWWWSFMLPSRAPSCLMLIRISVLNYSDTI